MEPAPLVLPWLAAQIGATFARARLRLLADRSPVSRLLAENSALSEGIARLREENALLRERIGKIPSRRRPRYSP